MVNEIGRLRAALARRESGRGRRFSPELRRQISVTGRRLRDEGRSWTGIGREIGLLPETVRRICGQTAPGFAPVEIVGDARVLGMVIVAPNGYRVEGLDVETVVALLARLA
jgi:hypothetical protein